MNHYKIKLQSNAQQTIAVQYNYIFCVKATAEFTIENVENKIKINKGYGTRFAKSYKELKVTSATNNNEVELIIGFGNIELPMEFGNNIISTTSVTPDTLTTAVDKVLAANTKTKIADQESTQKELIIQNNGNNDVRIGDSNTAANRGIEITKGSIFILTTTAAVYGLSTSGTTLSIISIKKS